MEKEKQFTILSIDGGGIRGLIPAKVGSVQLTVSSNNFSFSRPSKNKQGFGKEKFYFVNRSSKIIDNCDCIVLHPNIGVCQLSSTNCF